MSDVIDIACTSDGGYLPHTATMLHSLFSSNPGERFRVVLLHGNQIEADDRERLKQLAAPFGAEIRCIRIVPERVQDFPSLHLHRSVWYRLFLPDELPQLDRILYLDSDLLVLDRLRPLWETALGSNLMACVPNPLYAFSPDMVKMLGLNSVREYLNSGVMLMNLAGMRDEHALQQLLAYAKAHPQNPAQDQDAYSAVFHARCTMLPPRWNLQTIFFDLPPQDSAAQIGQPVEVVRQAIAHPAIVHFIGPSKPWRLLCGYPYTARYAEHRRQTPWPDFVPEKITPLDRWLRPLPVLWQDRFFKAWLALQPALRPLRALRRSLRG